MRIDHISEKQAARMGEWAEKWTRIGLSTEPADFDRATNAALRAYKLANLGRPMVVLRMSSPYGATVGGAMAWAMLREIFGKQVGQQVEQQVRQQVWQQVGQQVEQQVWQQVEQQVERQVWQQVGQQVWQQVEQQVGQQVRQQVWQQVWQQVERQVEQQVERQVWQQVGQQVERQVWQQVGQQVRQQVGQQVEQQVRQQVWQQVGQQVEQQVERQVWQQVERQVWQQVEGAAREGFSNYGINSLWCSWGSYVSFFRDVMGWNDPILDRFEIDEALMESCGWTWWHQNVLAISDRPEAILRDALGRLHSETEMAIRYRDGWGFHAIHGVVVPDWIVEQPERISAANIEEEANAEIRRVMMERFGYPRYMKECGAKIVHQLPADHPMVGLRDARLLVKEVRDDEPIVYVDLLNSTPEPDGTTKRYLLRVDPSAYGGKAARDCLAAVASTWRNKDGSLVFKRPQDYRPAFES